MSDQGIPTLRNMVVAIDGSSPGRRTLNTAERACRRRRHGRAARRSPSVRFSKLSLVDQLFHTVASPPVAYLLLLIGLSLLIFEFFTAGVGVAGVVGAGCVVLACYGLGVLPIDGWALAALVRRVLRARHRRADGRPAVVDGHRAGALRRRVLVPVPGRRCGRRGSRCWPASAASLLAFIVGMPSMVRTRFATPTIGREWMIGELGDAGVAIDPDGVAVVRRRAVAGPHQPGHAARQGRTGCGSSPSTASRSRSSRRRAGPRTTGSGAGAAPTGHDRRAGRRLPSPGRPGRHSPRFHAHSAGSWVLMRGDTAPTSEIAHCQSVNADVRCPSQ